MKIRFILPIFVVICAAISLTGCSFFKKTIDVSDIQIEPPAGQFLYLDDSGNGVNLVSVQVEWGVSERDYSSFPDGSRVHKGDPIIIVSGTIECQVMGIRYATLFATGYDAKGNVVSRTLDEGPKVGLIGFELEPRVEFTLHLSAADNIQIIKLQFPDKLYDIPPP